MTHERQELVLATGFLRAFLFQVLALGDVVVDFENTVAFAVALVLESPAAVDNDGPAIAARVMEFALPMARAPQSVEDSFERLRELRPQQVVRHLAERLVLSPAVTLGRAFVPVQDVALEVADQDTVLCQVQQRGLTLQVRLRLRMPDDIRRFACEQVEPLEGPLIGSTWRLVVRRQHPDRLSRSGQERRGLNGANAGLALHVQIAAIEDRTPLNILDDNPFAHTQCGPACSVLKGVHSPIVNPTCWKAALRHNAKVRLIRVQKLDTPKVRVS